MTQDEPATPQGRLTRRRALLGAAGLALFGGAGAGCASTSRKRAGEPRWSYPGVGFTPAAVDGVVYGTGPDLSAVDAATGKQRWSFRPPHVLAFTPGVAHGRVHVVGSNGQTIYTLNAQDGTRMWTYHAKERFGDGFISSPALGDATVYAPTADGVLHAVDAGTGAARWKTRVGNDGGDDGKLSAPLVVDNVIYVGRNSPVAARHLDDRLYALDAATGSVRWSYPVRGAGRGRPAAARDGVYVATPSTLLAISARSGAELWDASLGGALLSCAPVAADDRVYAAAAGGQVHCLDPVTGDSRWVYPAGAEVTAAPAIAGDSLYVGDAAGVLHALDSATGARRWRFSTNAGPLESSPVVAGNTVYIAGADSLHAVAI